MKTALRLRFAPLRAKSLNHFTVCRGGSPSLVQFSRTLREDSQNTSQSSRLRGGGFPMQTFHRDNLCPLNFGRSH